MEGCVSITTHNKPPLVLICFLSLLSPAGYYDGSIPSGGSIPYDRIELMSKDIEKHKAAKRDWYLRNKNLTYERTKQTREKRRNIIREIKESIPCKDCGVSYPYWVMQFDHIGTDEKIDTINTLLANSSMQVVMDEIAKCELVCSNCHATRTWKRLKDSDKNK
jgi:hypothetical protein